MSTQEEKQRYTSSELKEFEVLIQEKLDKSYNQLDQLKQALKDKSASANGQGLQMIEDNADAMEKEQINKLAARTQKFVKQLEFAMIRIKNGTYGICIDTGKLIPKERLRAVPHTQHTIEAKNARL